MITLLKKSSYQESLWKNGKGLTCQIAIFPEDASVAANNFQWRISSATVTQADSFSHFPDCERQLVVWTGDGLLLNQRALPPDSPLTFSGEEDIFCELIGLSPVTDLGIIYKKELIKVSLVALKLCAPTFFELNEGINFLFFAKGDDCIINGLGPKVGDCLKIENEEKLFISAKSHAPLTFYQLCVQTI